MMDRLSIVVPVMNEESCIGQLIDQFRLIGQEQIIDVGDPALTGSWLINKAHELTPKTYRGGWP